MLHLAVGMLSSIGSERLIIWQEALAAVIEHNGPMNPARTDPPNIDGLIVLGYLVLGYVMYALGVHALFFTPADGLSWARIGVLVLLCAILFLRRRRPLAALLLGTVPLLLDLAMVPSLPIWLIFGDLLYCATVYGRQLVGRILLIISIVLAVIGLGLGIWATGDVRGAILGVALVVLLVLMPVTWGLNVRTHRTAALLQQQRAEAERQRADAERARFVAEQARARDQAEVAAMDQAAAITEERQRLARDLHDSVAGHLGAIAIQSEAALATGAVPYPRQDVLNAVRANSVAALTQMQSMIELLRGQQEDTAATAPRLADLPELIEVLHAGGGSGGHVELVGQVPEHIDPEVDLTAYRICQEALVNGLKHAPGRNITLTIAATDDQLRVEVCNPVPGASHAAATTGPGGRGLENMHARAAAIRGQVDAGANDGNWYVRAQLPMLAGKVER